MKPFCVVKSPVCASGQQCSPGKSIEQGQHIATLALCALPASSKFRLKNSLYNTVAELSSSFCFFFPGLYLFDYFWNSYQLPTSIKSWEKVLQSLTVRYTKELFLHSTLSLPAACLEMRCAVIPTQSFWPLLQAEVQEIIFADSAVIRSVQQRQRHP